MTAVFRTRSFLWRLETNPKKHWLRHIKTQYLLSLFILWRLDTLAWRRLVLLLQTRKVVFGLQVHASGNVKVLNKWSFVNLERNAHYFIFNCWKYSTSMSVLSIIRKEQTCSLEVYRWRKFVSCWNDTFCQLGFLYMTWFSTKNT